MWIDNRGSEVLIRADCLRLVATEAADGGVGRLAVSGDRAPIVVPVNFSFSDHQVLVRVGEGSLWHQAKGQLVAFEVDHIDLGCGVAWSVLIRGLATELPDPVDAGLRRTPHPLVPEPGSMTLAIRPDVVTGRRFSISQRDS
jgi:nitroimidazol reductase NimA-like FMN-containing flavoprotein (pyridoxamine 5'-phosphate oxidase superfamily)